ncbi:hypothetical protein GCM10008967_35940 [Bacillus carboniphilus]|uniref:Uncharacterized protein n=1 Tax=Bacillus carboniphilus TaxID=86663 RepID=A0ABN0WP46_9BACI
MASIMIQAKGFGFEILSGKNEHMDGRYIRIEFEDGYQHQLADQYGWSQDMAEEKVDEVIENKLKEHGFKEAVIWEDREVFLIGAPSVSVDDVATVLLSLFPGAEVEERHSGSFLSSVFQKFKR